MSHLVNDIAAARRALATLTEVVPLLSNESRAQTRLFLAEFTKTARAFAQSATAELKPAFHELAPRWLAAFNGHSDLLRQIWRARKLGTLPARASDEIETAYLRRVLAHSLEKHGKKETSALIKEAENLAAGAAASVSDLLPQPEINAFVKQLGLLTRSEARELLTNQKKKFLREVASQRRITFTGEVDANFVRRIHDSAVRFARNTQI